MAVLPWAHSRSHPSNATEKQKTPSLDWFSRAATEPSRQAINQLMKQHSRVASSGAAVSRSQSRASTPSSQISRQYSITSKESKGDREARASTERSRSPASRPLTPIRPHTPGLERSDSTSKSLLKKGGGLLRRKSSKIGMVFNASPASTITSPTRPSSSRAGLRGKEVPTSPLKEETGRLSISNPFDFAHVMHGDLGSFSGLSRIDESDLASQFDAIQARYRITTDFQTPVVVVPQTVPAASSLTSASGEATALPQLGPSVGSRSSSALPAPKTLPLMASPILTDIRTSRSTDNFSRPNPRSPTRPPSCHLQECEETSSTASAADLLSTKPLPHLPPVGHAVSTQDDTARLLISAPLPTPPMTEKGSARHNRQSSSRGSLRHVSTFPSSHHSQSGNLLQENPLLNIKEEDRVVRPHSDYCLTNDRVYPDPDQSRLQTTGGKPLEVEDWEVAIDSAWDLEDESESSQSKRNGTRRTSRQSQARESFVIMEQSEQEGESLPSTPLMTMHSAQGHKERQASNDPGFARKGSDANPLAARDSACLVGLGIDTEAGATTMPHASRLPALEVVTRGINTASNATPRTTRSAYSAISHSSSQESIILSIASSIMSTQRSSVSSVSVSDFPQAGKSDRSSVANASTSPLLTVNSPKAARPDSNCLPTSLLKQHINYDNGKSCRPDSTCLPSTAQSKRNSNISKAERPESICLPQDVLSTFPVPECKGSRARTSQVKARESTACGEEDTVGDLPKDDVRTRRQSTSRNSTSKRISSGSSGDLLSNPRPRSSAQVSKPRNVRVSYSLFPPAGSTATTLPSTDSDASVP